MSKFATIYGLLGKGKELIFEDKVITDNGLYGAAEGYDAIGSVAVDVPHVNSLIDQTIEAVDSNATKIRQYLFQGCTKLKTANLPNATTIGEYAFADCSELVSVNAPNATVVPSYCHEYNIKLANVNYPKATRINTRAFSDCALTRITKDMFPDVTYIGESAFQRNAKLTYVDLPKVTSIKGQAFIGCGLEKLILRSSTFCELEHASAFQYCPSRLKIYVPSNLWSRYAENLSSNTWMLALEGDSNRIRVIEYESDDQTINGNIPG